MSTLSFIWEAQQIPYDERDDYIDRLKNHFLTLLALFYVYSKVYYWYIAYRARKYMIKEVVSGNTRRATEDYLNLVKYEKRSEVFCIRRDTEVNHSKQHVKWEIPEVEAS